MNKFSVAIAVVAVVVGLVAVSSVSASKKSQAEVSEDFEFESGGLERGGLKKGGRRHQPRHHHRRPCRGCDEGFRGERFRGDFEGEDFAEGSSEFSRGDRFRGDFEGEEGTFVPTRRRSGGFEGAGVFGGLKKEKKFDAGVRGSSKDKNRNQFSKNKAFVGGEQKSINGGVSSSDRDSLEGVHKHKNLNNDRLVVKETQRGTEDTDVVRGQHERNDEGHFGASEGKVFGGSAGESGLSEQEHDRDFEGDVHKKDSFAAGGGGGVVGGRF